MINIAHTLFTFDSFLYGYLIFLFFIIFIVGLAGSQLTLLVADFSDNNIQAVYDSFNLNAAPPDEGGSWLSGFLFTANYFVTNIALFFTIMTMDTGMAWLTLLVFSPAVAFLIYGMLRLLRGGG